VYIQGPKGMSAGRLSALAIAALLVSVMCSQACNRPTVSILWPKNGTILGGITGFDVQFNVTCAAFPGDVFVRLWEVTTRATDNYVDMFTWKIGQFSHVTEGGRRT
jgi:hypothetical protein